MAGNNFKDVSYEPSLHSCKVSINSLDELYGVLADAGCLVVEGLASKETIGAVKTELAADMAAVSADEDDPAAFYPGLTRRVTG